MKKILFLLGLACGSLLTQTYVLAEINQNNKKESFKNTQVFIQIDSKKHRFNGNSGCNNFFGAWNQKSEASTIGSTMMACSPSENELEQKILSFFDRAVISFSSNEVKIKNQKGEVIFRKSQ